ncbi:MAG: aspartate/glutamate racemase family protein [Nitrososphaeria archaeon]|nr:aspartate/glutamate racemase family protein [Aigarchaeota archaeon]MCX8187634.1 aspartate/glutamate racemase family protein [Nitrososphaeria archaeon]MDW8021529.1 aspartate/glutamate racemase family protein [Nitrososphaerota archaeon]
MRVLVINPIGDNSWDESDKNFYKVNACPTTNIDVVSLGRGPPSVETLRDLEVVKPLIKELALQKYKMYDGLIINCFLDPAVDELRKILDRPVVGPCEASLAFGSLFTDRLGVVSIEGEALNLIKQNIKKLSYGHKVVSIRGIKTRVVDLRDNWDRVKAELREESKKALSEGAEVIILGCTGLAGLGDTISRDISKPVIDPAVAALKMIESLISLKLMRGGI